MNYTDGVIHCVYQSNGIIVCIQQPQPDVQDIINIFSETWYIKTLYGEHWSNRLVIPIPSHMNFLSAAYFWPDVSGLDRLAIMFRNRDYPGHISHFPPKYCTQTWRPDGNYWASELNKQTDCLNYRIWRFKAGTSNLLSGHHLLIFDNSMSLYLTPLNPLSVRPAKSPLGPKGPSPPQELERSPPVGRLNFLVIK